jgi:hypothetical protein
MTLFDVTVIFETDTPERYGECVEWGIEAENEAEAMKIAEDRHDVSDEWGVEAIDVRVSND